MNDMIVKSVDVMGDSIMAAQDKDGVVWAGVSYFCKALGLSRTQTDRQIRNIKKDEVLKRGYSKLAVGVFDENNETYAIRIDFVPLWLAKINITNKTTEQNPDLAEKLLKYQLKAKDILAEAFLPKQTALTMTVPEQIKLLAQGNVELNKRVDTLEERFTKFEDDMPLFQVDTKDIQKAVKKRAIELLGGKESNAYKDVSVRSSVFADIQCELRRNFGVRRYDEIRHKRVKDAIEIVMSHKLPLVLMERVQMANAQQNLRLVKGGAAI